MIKRQPIFHDDCVEILLTKGQSAFVDLEDAGLASLNWTAQQTDTTWYGYRQAGGIKTYLHRAVADRAGKYGMIVDHKDGDGRNCRRDNIRPANNQTSSYNKGTRKDNTSGRKGVYWFERDKTWLVRITFERKTVHLGYYKDLELATFVREEAEIKYHGEFRR